MSVLYPFSAGLAYGRTTPLRGLVIGRGGGRGKVPWGDPIAHRRYFGSLYRHSDRPFFSEPLNAWDELIADSRHVFEFDVVPTPQPVWDFADPASQVAPPLAQADDTDAPRSSRQGSGTTRRPHSDRRRADTLAWYAPAHTCSEDEYGIHMTQTGIVKAAAAVQWAMTDAGADLSRRSAVVIGAFALYCHELGHALVEDVASIIEFSGGPARYIVGQRAYGGYALMEEAFCNTLAFACVVKFFDPRGQLEDPGRLEHYREFESKHGTNYECSYAPEPEPTFQVSEALDAIERWMRSQPDGYSAFLADRSSPSQNGLLWLNLARVLVDLYGYSPWEVSGALEVIGVHGNGPLEMLLERPDTRNPTELLSQVRAEKAPEGYGWPIHIHR
jgi:hypothetical protein